MQSQKQPNYMCRKCGGELITKFHNYKRPFKQNQVWYYTQHDYCLKCRTVYLDIYYRRRIPKNLPVQETRDCKKIADFWDRFNFYKEKGYAGKEAFKLCINEFKYRPPQKPLHHKEGR